MHIILSFIIIFTENKCISNDTTQKTNIFTKILFVHRKIMLANITLQFFHIALYNNKEYVSVFRSVLHDQHML